MTREELARAGEHFERAADAAGEDEAAGTMRDLADQLERLADRDQDPDHGRLARIQNHANDVKAGAEGETVEAIDAGSDAVDAFRETIEGV